MQCPNQFVKKKNHTLIFAPQKEEQTVCFRQCTMLTWVQQYCDLLPCKFLLIESVHARLATSSSRSASRLTLLEQMSRLCANFQPPADAR